MVASGVGQFSINVKDNLDAFYGKLSKSYKTMKELTDRKNQLQIDSKQLDQLRDKAQRIAAEIRELKQQKTEIRLGMKGDEEISKLKNKISDATRDINYLNATKLRIQSDPSAVKNADKELENIDLKLKSLKSQKLQFQAELKNADTTKEQLKELDKNIASLNRQKLELEAEIQPIRTANVELHKTEQEIDRINSKKVSIDFGDAGAKLDGLSNKVFGLIKALGTMGAGGVATVTGVLKEAVNEASDLEQNLGGVQKIFGDEASKKVVEDAKKAYKEAGLSQNEYLEQATSFSASLITELEKGQTKTIDNSSQKEVLKKQKADIEKALKENNYSSAELNLNSETKYEYKTNSKGKTTRKKVEDTDKKNQLKQYKKNALDLKKQKDKIDEQIANLPESTTEQVGGMSKEDAQKSAADYVKKALVDMSDNANTFGTNIGEIQHAYEGIFKNNYTMIDNLKLGFKGSQEGAIEAVNTYGNLDEKITDISQVTGPMMIETIHNAQKAMSISGTTAKEAAETYEGSLKMMKGAWKNFLADGTTSDLEIALPIYFDNLDKKLKDLTPKLVSGLKKMVKVLPPKLKPVFEDLKKLLEESFDAVFGKGFSKNFEDGMKPFADFISGIFKMFTKSTNGKKLDLSGLGSVIPDLLKLAIGLKVASFAFKGIKFTQDLGLKIPSFKGIKGLSGIGKSAKEMKNIGINDLKSLGMKMLTIAGISANIYFAAKALEEVQNVGDLGSLQPKMFAIAEAVTGMGVLVAAAGFINEKKPGLMISGLATVALIAGDIYLAALALEEVDNIKGNFGSVQSKIGQIALSITEIGLLTGAVGFVMDTGVGAAVLGSGLLAILAIAGTIYLTGQAVASISNLEIDKEKIKTNIEAIKDTLTLFSTLGFDGSPFKKFGELLNSLMELGIVASVLGIGKQLEELQDLELNKDTINTYLGIIKEVITELGEFGFDGSIFDKFGEFLNSFMEKGVVDNILNIGNDLSKLQNLELDKENVTGSIDIIKEVISSISDNGEKKSLFSRIGDLIYGAGDSVDFRLANAKFKEIKAIGDTLSQIQGLKLNKDVLVGKDGTGGTLGVIQSAIDSISNYATDDIVNNLGGMAEALATITKEITKNYPPEYADLGKLLATKMNEGFKSNLNFKKAVSDRMGEINKTVSRGKGSELATGMNRGFESTLDIGKKIKKQINDALNDEKVKKQIQEAISKEYKATVVIDVDKNSKAKKGNRAAGGLITAKNGERLMDSPEKPLINNGEYVIPKRIVDALGVTFFDKLRSGQISRTFTGLGQKVSHTTSNVVNNIYNNTTNQNMNVYPGPRQDVMFIANRRMRV